MHALRRFAHYRPAPNKPFHPTHGLAPFGRSGCCRWYPAALGRSRLETREAPVILDFRTAALGDAGSVADAYLRSRKELVACAPLVHPDEAVREWIRRQLIPAGRTTVAVVDGGWLGS